MHAYSCCYVCFIIHLYCEALEIITRCLNLKVVRYVLKNGIYFLLVAFFVFVSVGLLLSSVGEWRFGVQFERNADEAWATVKGVRKQVDLSEDSDGDTKEIIRYYVWLALEVEGLPSDTEVEIESKEVDDILGKERVLVYYLQGDVKHITLSRDHWRKFGKGGLVISSVFLIGVSVVFINGVSQVISGIRRNKT